MVPLYNQIPSADICTVFICCQCMLHAHIQLLVSGVLSAGSSHRWCVHHHQETIMECITSTNRREQVGIRSLDSRDCKTVILWFWQLTKEQPIWTVCNRRGSKMKILRWLQQLERWMYGNFISISTGCNKLHLIETLLYTKHSLLSGMVRELITKS